MLKVIGDLREAPADALVHRPLRVVADIAIAACAIVHDAAIWTLNEDDFSDLPGLELV